MTHTLRSGSIATAIERRQQIVDLLVARCGEPVTSRDIEAALGVSQGTVARLLEPLMTAGTLRPAGKRPTGKRQARLYALTDQTLIPGAAHHEDRAVMRWTAAQAVATRDLPHRAVSEATRQAARAGR